MSIFDSNMAVIITLSMRVTLKRETQMEGERIANVAGRKVLDSNKLLFTIFLIKDG